MYQVISPSTDLVNRSLELSEGINAASFYGEKKHKPPNTNPRGRTDGSAAVTASNATKDNIVETEGRECLTNVRDTICTE